MRTVRGTLLVVLALNAAVTAIKFIVGAHTAALTLVGAGLESALDLLNNVIAFTLVGIAHRAPDEEHPYVHAKFETLGALAVVGFLSISCFELLREGVRHLIINEHPVFPSLAELSLIAATMFVNVGAYVDTGTMVDSHALIGSCAQIGQRVHVSAAAQIGGVLEPVNASPVVIEVKNIHES